MWASLWQREIQHLPRSAMVAALDGALAKTLLVVLLRLVAAGAFCSDHTAAQIQREGICIINNEGAKKKATRLYA